MSSKSKSQANQQNSNPDWTEVVIEVILKILTLGFYHVRKHQDGNEQAS